MRRIAIALTLLALVGGAYSCSSDAPTPPTEGLPPGVGPSRLLVRLFTSDANPRAGSCTLIQAIVTLEGSPVPNGTGVAFSSDFGEFAQNGLALISVVTQNGAAVTALCSGFPGTAVVRANVTVANETASATIALAFQPSAGAGPFISFCSPSFGPATGGTTLTISGGAFFGDTGSTRVSFEASGIVRQGLVRSLTLTTITVLTPGFPELTAPSVPVNITITLGANSASAVTLLAPNCFAFGRTDRTTPTITAVLPSSGSNEGRTRVTIIGSGFEPPVQVFFGLVEAEVISVSFHQIVVLSPPAFGPGRDNRNASVEVRVRNVTSGLEGSLALGFRYVTPVQLISISNNLQRVDEPFSPVTIFGHGFQAPVAVSLAGVAATVISVSATELLVRPTAPLLAGCSNISGPVVVTNINSGDTATGLSFTYLVALTGPIITGISPSVGPGAGGTSVTITGANFPSSIVNTIVRFGGRAAAVTGVTPTSITVLTPPSNVTTPPACPSGVAGGTLVTVETVDVTVTNRATTCSDTFTQAFRYQLACVVPTATPTFTPTATPTATPTPTP